MYLNIYMFLGSLGFIPHLPAAFQVQKVETWKPGKRETGGKKKRIWKEKLKVS